MKEFITQRLKQNLSELTEKKQKVKVGIDPELVGQKAHALVYPKWYWKNLFKTRHELSES